MLYVNPMENRYPRTSGVEHLEASRRKAALEEYEQLFLYQMLREMRKMSPEGGLLSGSKQEAFFEEMLDDVYAKEMARSGQFGIAALMEAQLDQAQSFYPHDGDLQEAFSLKRANEAYSLTQQALSLTGYSAGKGFEE